MGAETSPRPGADVWVAAVHAGEKDRRPLGSGFLIDSRRVLTCAHVVFESRQQRPELWVAFPKAHGLRRRRVRVHDVVAPPPEEQDIDDVAVLVLAEQVPEEYAARVRQPDTRSLVRRRWWAFGFPDGMLGNSADGVIGEELGYGWIRLDTGSRYGVKSGFSGAALWSPDYDAVVGMVGQAQGSNGDARAITLQGFADCLPGQKLHLLSGWSAEAAGESALAAWGWGLAEDPEAGRHWRPRSRGVSTDAERGFRFRGRAAALSEIRDWLISSQPKRRVLVVTGSPGVGKSAVLGRIVTTADPGIAASLPLGDDAVRAHEGSVACAVHAKGKTALEVADEIARAASARLPIQVQDLAPNLRDALDGSGRPGFTLVIDALDEVVSPQQARLIIHHIARPLAENLDHLGVRVIVGSRRRDDDGPLLDAFGNPGVIDLDTSKYFDRADLAAYAMATLQLHGDERHDNPYNAPKIAEPVAERIALLAEGNFLVAGLVARAHGMYDQLPVPAGQLTFPPTVDAALSEYLALLPGVAGVPATALLTSLAYAEAPGMTADLWQTAITALGYTTPTEQRLRTFASSSAANFLIETSTAELPAPAFRLFHQALNDALLRHRDKTADERTITTAFMDLGRETGWAHAATYLLRSLAGHAARGHAIDQLLREDAYLLHADLRRLIPAATAASTPTTHARARLLRTTPRAIDATPAERVALYSISEAVHDLGSTYRDFPSSALYRARWAATKRHDEETLLEGHGDWVMALCAVPARGRALVASASHDGTVRLWDPATGTHEHRLDGHSRPVTSLCAVPAGSGRIFLASGSQDHTVRLWDPAIGTQEHLLRNRKGRVTSLCAVPAGDHVLLASGGQEGSVQLWDPATGTQKHQLGGRTRPVRALCAVPADGGRMLLASACEDGTVCLWDPATGALIHQLDGHRVAVRALCTVPAKSGALLATGSRDCTVRLWDPVTGTEEHRLDGHSRPVTSLCVVPAGDRQILVASASYDGTIRLWDPETGTQKYQLDGHTDRIASLCTVPDAEDRILLASASYDGSVRLWDPETGMQESRRDGHTGRITSLCTVPDGGGGTLLATASHDRTVRLWNPTIDSQEHQGDGRADRTTALCAVTAGDGRTLLATADTDDYVWLWDPTAGTRIHCLDAHAAPVTALCTVPADGLTLLATGSHDCTVRLWNPVVGTETHLLLGHTDPVTTMCTVPTAGRTLLATASYDRTVRLWDPVTGAQKHLLYGHTSRVTALCTVAAGGRTLLASASEQGTVCLWDPVTGNEEHLLNAHTRPVTALCAVPANRRFLLAAGSYDHTVSLWNPETGSQRLRLDGHTARISALCAVPSNGRTLLASASEDCTVSLWDPDTGAEKHVLSGHTDPVTSVCAVPTNGRTLLATASYDRTVRLWEHDGSPLSEIPVAGVPTALIAMNGLLAVALDNGVLTVGVGRAG
ncbi:trypsin-like peptidase domain-containing protein [Streptomyces collinus]|uniref:trypsin-like peptidase domain-containing protein n=1 Tax=Streptomyces collinus TaxID=42684 RepID=UPI003668A7F8